MERDSMKHTSTDGLAARIGDAMRSYDYVASMDFGSSDGSCTKAARDIVENGIVVALCKTAFATMPTVTD